MANKYGLKKLSLKIQDRLKRPTSLAVPNQSPDELLGELFTEVQLHKLHSDSKTFSDSVPVRALHQIVRAYQIERQKPGFNLETFVSDHFAAHEAHRPEIEELANIRDPKKHITKLWDALTHKTTLDAGSLIALPYPYVVPGGRFSELFYWDSYFVMVGLAEDNRYDLIENMMKDFAFLIRKVGFVPSGNRTYLISRSQPPFFSYMVKLLAAKKGKRVLVKYLPYLLAEYGFWMRGKPHSGKNGVAASGRSVRLPDDSVLNRYYDNKSTPRPEAFKEDVATAESAKNRLSEEVYRDLRAAAESGWDFSARWLSDGKTLKTIHTTDIIPVDLNCLLYHLEQTIAEAYDVLKQHPVASRYRHRAEARADAINKYCWSDKDDYYFDYDFTKGERTDCWSLAGAFTLLAGIADERQAGLVRRNLNDKFLKEGGLLTTLSVTGEQWDAPNGWAPLQWVVVQGLERYGYHDLAQKIRRRWVRAVLNTYKRYGKMVEKYNVENIGSPGGGGEYPLQDGFGWTNGVTLEFINRLTKK